MAIVKNKKNNFVYRYIGKNVFKNVVTGVIGEVSDEAARKTFVISVEATVICEEYPMVEELIKALQLKFEK